MEIKGVIFDLDGVIVSTDHYHYLGWKKVADEENIYFDESINNRLRGVSRLESLAIVLERAAKTYTENEKLNIAERKNEYYRAYLSELTKESILPGVMEVLECLKKNKMKIAIGSSSKNTPTILKRIELDDFFDAVADGNDIQFSKPHPEVFLIAAKKIGLDPAFCAVVEDAIAGIDAAVAGGMTSVAISDAFGYEKASYSIRDMKELLGIVGLDK